MAACAPLIVGDIIYVVTANGVDEGHINIPSPNAPSFIALNKKTGKLVWQDSSPGKMIMHGQWSNPTYAVAKADGKDVPQVIFPGGDGWLYSFEPASGKLLWKFDANPKDSKYELGGMGTRSDFIATPVVVDNLLYIGTGQDPEHYEGIGHLWCVDINKASAKGGDVSPDLVTDAKADPVKFKPNPNSAVLWHYGGPYSKEDAAKFGRDYPFGRTMSTASVHDGILYVAELAGFMHCLDAKTGKHLWQHDLKAAVWGSTLYVDGKVYIATEDGDVWTFTAGREKKEPKRVEVGQPIRSTPVVANGVLYVMSESHLFAIGK
jgi:outer membrane protein assembly factor BamB